MGYCLPQYEAERFKNALRTGEITPSKLVEMGSAGRREFFKKYMGEMHAQNTNALFESKLLLKNQERGLINWAKKVAGLTPESRRDLIAKIGRIQSAMEPEDLNAFLEDFVAKRLGFDVSVEEAKTLSVMSRKVEEARSKIPINSPDHSPQRLEYGARAIAFRNYVNDLKEGSKLKGTPGLGQAVNFIAQNAKALNATADFSALFNQGINLLFTNPTIWLRNALKVIPDVFSALAGKDVRSALDADLVSRQNYLNGAYETMGVNVGVLKEEGLPANILERIPGIKRLGNAADVAYNGFILRGRADYADKIIKVAERNGLDITDPEQVQGLGRIVNSITGRGNLGSLEGGGADVFNNVFFSPRFLKSNYDVLVAGLTDKTIRSNPLAMRIAAGNLIKIVAGIGGIMAITDRILPGSVEWDPRSSRFGINVGNTHFDITGGKKAILVLAARLVTEETKSPTTGKITKLNSGKYGSKTELDLANAFIEGKLSPLAGVIRDKLRGEFYSGEEFNYPRAGLNLVTPISFQTGIDVLNDPGSAPALASLILAGLGVNVTEYQK